MHVYTALGPLELESSCPRRPDALLMLPAESKLQPLTSTGALQHLFGVSVRKEPAPFLTLNSSSQEHGHVPGEDAWLQEQFPFSSPTQKPPTKVHS